MALLIEIDANDSIPEQDSSSDSDSDTGRSSAYDSGRLKKKAAVTKIVDKTAKKARPTDMSASRGGRAKSQSRPTQVPPVPSPLKEFKKRFPHLDIGLGRRILKMNGHTVVAEEILPRMEKTRKPKSLPTDTEAQIVRPHKVTPKRRSATNTNNNNNSNPHVQDSVPNPPQNSKRKANDPSYEPPSNKRPKKTHAQPQRVSTRDTSAKTVAATQAVSKTKNKDSKPGTAGSRQALAPNSRRTKDSDIEAILLHNGRRIETEKTPFKPIDTGCMVDDTLISFILEIGQREQLETLPRDPLRLCKGFSIILPNCDVAKAQKEQEKFDNTPEPQPSQPPETTQQANTDNCIEASPDCNGAQIERSQIDEPTCAPVDEPLAAQLDEPLAAQLDETAEEKKQDGDYETDKVQVISDKLDSPEDRLSIDPAEISPILS